MKLFIDYKTRLGEAQRTGQLRSLARYHKNPDIRQGSPSRKRGCGVPANESSSYGPAASRHGFDGAADLVGECNSADTLRTADEHAVARNAPIAYARALSIYLRHRGVLNVEEFRRTNARGL